MRRFFLLVFLLVAVINARMAIAEKVMIFTYSYNCPEFIELQDKTFKRFMKDDYEFVVFNDASTLKNQISIIKTCERLGIQCINIPQNIHKLPYLERRPEDDWNGPSVRNCNAVQYSLDTVGFYHDGIIILVDSDLFLVKEFSAKEHLGDYHISGVRQLKEKNGKTVPYLWIGLVFMDFSKMPNKSSINFNCGEVDGVRTDSGGYTYYYLRDNETVNVKYLGMLSSPFIRCEGCESSNQYPCVHSTNQLIEQGFDKYQIEFIQAGPPSCEFYHQGHFLHYRAGTNWNCQTNSFHQNKKRIFRKYIEAITSL